jgi:hypothetical protein
MWSKTHLVKDPQTKLEASGPHLQQGTDTRFFSWYMTILNQGSVMAENVTVRLRNIDPKPKDPMWGASYPYPVLGAEKINPNDQEQYRLITSWPNNGDVYTSGLDTKSSFRNDIRIESDEVWVLEYEITAANAEKTNFILEANRENRRVVLKRKN